MEVVLIILAVILAVVSVVLLLRGLSGGSSSPASLEKPAHNDVYIGTGYDYKTKSYRIWMSPMMELPYTQERFDAYLEAEEIASVEYTNDGITALKTSLIQKILSKEGWRVHRVDPPILLEHLPHWVREAGGEMKKRDTLKDSVIWAMRGKDFVLRDDLKRKVEGRDRRAKQNAEFNRTMQPVPDWARSKDEDHDVQLREDLERELEPYRQAGDPLHFFKGLAYEEKGDYDRAIAEYDLEIAIDPSNPGNYHTRGSAYVDRGDIARGIQDHDKAIALSEYTSETETVKAMFYRDRGYAYLEKGDFDIAIIDFGEAILLDPLSPLAYGMRAYAYESQGEYVEAGYDWETYAELNDE